MKAKGMATWGAWEPTVSLGAAQQAHVDSLGNPAAEKVGRPSQMFHHFLISHSCAKYEKKKNKQTNKTTL